MSRLGRERREQQLRAYAHSSSMVLRHHFVLAPEFGGTFSAIAPTREAALLVMDAECRGASLTARYDGTTVCPCHRERTREVARFQLRDLGIEVAS